MNQNPHPNFLTGPQQIPLFPIYGYDNLEEAELDFDYMKQLYPRDTRMIQDMIEDTCDRLEYAGSLMFDEYPDRLQVALLANKIYNQVTGDGGAGLSAQSPPPAGRPPSGPGRPPSGPGGPPPGNNNPNWLRDMIEIMLCNEMCQRRRRYRSRRRWM